jgi:hypothetical protein
MTLPPEDPEHAGPERLDPPGDGASTADPAAGIPAAEPIPDGVPATQAAPVEVPAPRPPPVVPLPGFRSGLGLALDLSLHASRRLRPASIYIGLQYLAVLGPVVLLFVAILVANPDFGDLMGRLALRDPLGPSDAERVGGWFLLLAPGSIIATLALIALSVDSQIVALLILGGQLVGRPVGLRAAITMARARFWAVIRAGLLIGIPTVILNLILTAAFGPILGTNTEGTALAAAILSTFALLPFVYTSAAVVLGEVGAMEAAKRSVRLERSRARLAVLIAVFSAAIGYIQLFALDSGGSILIRVGETVGLGFDRGPAAASATIVLILAAIVALGSLSFTVTALAAAPQVVAFMALTGYTGAIDRTRAMESAARPPELAVGWAPPPPRRRAGWISRPMLAGIVIGIVVAAFGITTVLGG